MPLQEQSTQIKSSQTFNDALAIGSGLQPASGASTLEGDLNSIRTQLRAIIDSTHWYSAITDTFNLTAIHNKMFVERMPPVIGTTQFTLGGAAAGVLAASTLMPSGVTKVAVGASSTTDGGLQTADEANFTTAGTLAVGLTLATDSDGIVLNKVDLLSSTTDSEPVATNGETVFGLMQSVHGVADAATIAASPNQNVQISFAYYAQGTGTLTSFSLPAGTYYFAPNRAHYFYSLTRGATLGGGLPALVDTTVASKMPYRAFFISGTAPAAADPMTVTTGAFTTAGAQSAIAGSPSYGTTTLPATGALFQADSRIQVWVNGQKMVKADQSGRANTDVFWSSATQLAFNIALFANDVIEITTPSAY